MTRTQGPGLLLRGLGTSDYAQVHASMRAVTDQRGPNSADELWWLEHPSVFTLGQAGRMEHLRSPGAIPVVQSDRGGQVTYHGPGQLVIYLMLDLRRLGIGIRVLVQRIEQSVINLLSSASILGERRCGAPGVYVDGKKIAALGLRVRRGCTYHGLALNVDMDLAPFKRIDPCGFADLEVTQLRELGVHWSIDECAARLIDELGQLLGYRKSHMMFKSSLPTIGTPARMSSLAFAKSSKIQTPSSDPDSIELPTVDADPRPT